MFYYPLFIDLILKTKSLSCIYILHCKSILQIPGLLWYSKLSPLRGSQAKRTHQNHTTHMAAAQLLQLPEDDFKSQFRQLLQTCPVVHAEDYVGRSVAPRSNDVVRKRIETRVVGEKEKQKELEQFIKRDENRVRRDAKKKNVAATKRTSAAARAEPRVTSAQFWKKMKSLLARGAISEGQAAQVVQQFKMIQTQYVSSMSLEDIEEIAGRM